MSIVEAYLRQVRRWRWSLLLAILIATFVLHPFWSETGFGRIANFTAFIMVFGGAVHAGSLDPLAVRCVTGLLLLALLLEILDFLGVGGLRYALAGIALVIVLCALVATFIELVGNRESTPDSLVGAIFGFFVIAAAWALLYRHLEAWLPGSFRFPEATNLDTQLLYFSLVTITTVGYGDITPVTPLAQIWTALEAAIGTLYIAILIGRIVGQVDFRAKRSDRE
jgi:hypothetical protein